MRDLLGAVSFLTRVPTGTGPVRPADLTPPAQHFRDMGSLRQDWKRQLEGRIRGLESFRVRRCPPTIPIASGRRGVRRRCR